MKAKKTPQRNNSGSLTISQVVVGFFLGILILLISFMVYSVVSERIALSRNKQKFLSAKPIVEQVARNVRQQMPEYTWKNDAKCVTEKKKWDVYTSCGISVRTLVIIDTKEQAQGLIDKFSLTLDQQDGLRKTEIGKTQYPDFDKYFAQKLDPLSFRDLDMYGQSASYAIQGSELGCGKNTSIESSDPGNHTLELSLSLDCSDSALKEWYSPNP